MSSNPQTSDYHYGNNHNRRQNRHHQMMENGNGSENGGHHYNYQSNGYPSNYNNAARNRRSMQPRSQLIPQDTMPAAAAVRQNAAAKLAHAAWKRHSMTEAPQGYDYMQYADYRNQQQMMMPTHQALIDDDMSQLT